MRGIRSVSLCSGATAIPGTLYSKATTSPHCTSHSTAVIATNATTHDDSWYTVELSAVAAHRAKYENAKNVKSHINNTVENIQIQRTKHLGKNVVDKLILVD